MVRKGKFKLLYIDLKPDEKLSGRLLELFRRVPVECSIAKIEYFFIYNFDVESAVEGLTDRCKRDVGNLYHITVEDAEFPVFSGEVKPLEFPEDVKADFMEIWVNGSLDDRWRIVSDIFRDCKMFRVREDLYIVETLIKYEGYKYYVVKVGDFAKKSTYIDDDGLRVSEYENAWRKKPVRTRKGKKTWVRVLAKHSLIMPEAVVIVNKMTRDLIYEVSNGRCFMCSFSVEATEEAIKLLSELRDNPEIWGINLWKREEVYSGKIGFDEFLKFDEKCWAAIASNYKGYNSLKDPTGWRSPENLEAFRRSGWGWKGCMGLVVVENGYDVKVPYSGFLRLEKYYKWRNRFLEWGREICLPEKRLRTFYNL